MINRYSIPFPLPPHPLRVSGSDKGSVGVSVLSHPGSLLLAVGIVRVYVRVPSNTGIGGTEGGGDRVNVGLHTI